MGTIVNTPNLPPNEVDVTVPQTSQTSGFSTFQSEVDYDIKDWIDTKSWTKKRVYDQNPYLSFSNQKFNIKVGQLKPYFYAYIRHKGELFADDVAFDLTGYNVYIYVYDSLHNLATKGKCVVTNPSISEICYEWQPLDIQKCGFYTCELEFIDSNNITFRLPDDKNKFEIIVSE